MVRRDMPSLIKLLVSLAILAGLVYGGMLALATLVEPTPRDMSFTVPADRFRPDPNR
jgi:hypothetical protein